MDEEFPKEPGHYFKIPLPGSEKEPLDLDAIEPKVIDFSPICAARAPTLIVYKETVGEYDYVVDVSTKQMLKSDAENSGVFRVQVTGANRYKPASAVTAAADPPPILKSMTMPANMVKKLQFDISVGGAVGAGSAVGGGVGGVGAGVGAGVGVK